MKHSIVTKTGDDGKTFLLGGVRISKSHIRVKSYGESDELNSYLGLVQSQIENQEINLILNQIQMQLFDLSAILATPLESINEKTENKNVGLLNKGIAFLEEKINLIEPQLPELKNFILPGGSKGASFLHVARTICRRAERTIVELANTEKIDSKLIIYFNRLSDLLFILARYENFKSHQPEILWKPDHSPDKN